MGYCAPPFNEAAPSWRDDIPALIGHVTSTVAGALKDKKARAFIWLGDDHENSPDFSRKLVEMAMMLPGVEKAAYIVKEFPMSPVPDVGYLQIDLKHPQPAKRRGLFGLFKR